MKLAMKKDHFLTNKQKFIWLLSESLAASRFFTYHAKSDADLLIVQKAVEEARQGPTVLIGEDTDLFVFLCYHADPETELFFKSELQNHPKVWDIKVTKATLGPIICKNIIFIHAILGCDTTSKPFGLGKGVGLKKMNVSLHFRIQASIFQNSASSASNIEKAGEGALVCLTEENLA